MSENNPDAKLTRMIESGAVRVAIKLRRARRRLQNRDAIKAYNDRVAKEKILSDFKSTVLKRAPVLTKAI